MRKSILSLMLIAFIATANTFAQTADDIVNKYIEAIGGKDNLKKLKSIKRTGSLEFQPGMKAPVTLQLIDNQSLRFDLVIQGMTMTQVIDGNTGWMIMPFQGSTSPEPIPSEQVKEMKAEMDITSSLYNYKAKGFSVELAGSDKVNEADCYKLKVTDKDGKFSYYYIDKTSNYLVKEMQMVKAEDKEMEVSKIYGDYKKDPSGIVFAYKLTTDNGGGDITWETIETNPKIESNVFKMPGK